MYSGNGSDSGVVPVDTMEYFMGDSAVIMGKGNLKKTSYTFSGWNTETDGIGVDYFPNTVIMMKAEDVQIFAKWKINQYRVTFDSRGGSTIPEQSVDYGARIAAPSVPTRGSMVFGGWFRDTLYSIEWVFSSDTARTDLILYAKWSNQYEMKWIATKGKSFQMGEAGIADTVHTVNFFSDGYWIDSTEVTQSEYEAVMSAAYPAYRRPVWNHGTGPDYPVYNISWYDAVLYCNARTKASGSTDTIYEYNTFTGTPGDTDCVLGAVLGLFMKSGIRLTTEAEWEFACRGGTATRYFWGDDTLKATDYAWYSGNAEQFKPVAQKAPNPFGLYDMIGNAFEICEDVYGVYSQGSVYEPTSPGPVTEANTKTCRGGNWQSTTRELGSANRGKVLVYERKPVNGFRVCRSIK
jgi:formylglycine-generating enzyme required for sulfatase activity